MGQMVIVVYRPRPGREGELLELVRGHVPALRAEGLATARAPLVMRAADGALVEIFEWTSAEAVEGAHHNLNVQAMWGRFAEVCEYQTLAGLPEAQRLFSPFDPVEL
ncbi:MAG: hypothetical protein KY467_04510 [Gemmatimonadetes bacterium]|nr:hypothetical protein [Gemmatimonadota bacterium]